MLKILVRRVTSIMLVCLTLCSLLVSSPTVVHAEGTATDRIITYVNLAAGKQVVDIESNMDFTKDELRFLGVYLSNFYIPFGSELGITDGDSADKTKEGMKKALANSLKFSDDMADVFVENIIGLSRSNCQELKFYVSKDYHKGYKEVSQLKVNYFNFLRLMLGQTQTVFEGWNSISNTSGSNGVTSDILHSVMTNKEDEITYTYGYFGIEKNGKFVPMFDCKLGGKKITGLTPSQYAFYQCLASVDTEKGYGFSFFDFTKEEAEDDKTLQDMLKDLNEDEVYKMSIYGSTVNVDCFGNIIIKGANHQYVAVPGCMNPYTWVATTSDGKDLYNPGTCYNMVSFMGLGMSDTGALLKDNAVIEKDSKKKSLKVSTLSTSKLRSNFGNLAVVDSWGAKGDWFERKTKMYPMRMLRGSTDIKLGKNILKLSFTSSKYLDLVKKAQNGFTAANPEDHSYYGSVTGGLKTTIWNWGLAHTKASERLYCVDEIKTDSNMPDPKVRILDNFVFIDNLGAFGFDNTKNDVDYKAINIKHYIDNTGGSPLQLFSNWGSDSSNGFSNMYTNIESGNLNTTVTADDAAIVGVYTTYAISGLYEEDDEAKKETVGQLGYRLNRDGLIDITNDPITLPDSIADGIIESTIENWIYYLLHPTKGLDYVRILITNKVSAFLVGWHNDMVGTNSVGATTGTTLYRNNIGYVTTPDLSELDWTNSLINIYNEMIPFLVVVMLVTMLFAYITGIMSLQKCIFGLVIFSCFLLTPVNLINGVVSASNRITQNIYGEKFTYWALVQQESYVKALDSAATEGTYENYLRTLYATNSAVYKNQGSDSIVLKWQAPKKMASLMLSEEDGALLNNLQSSKLIGMVVNRNSFNGESYLGNDDTAYMYRSYTDLGNFSRYIYNGLYNGTRKSYKKTSSSYYKNLSKNTRKKLDVISKNFTKDRKSGYSNTNKDGSTDYKKAQRLTKLLSCKMYNDAIKQKGKVKKLKITDFVGINQDTFNFSVAMFNNKKENFKKNLKVNAQPGNLKDFEKYIKKYSEADLSSLAAYSLMSENPYYYFSWGLYDMGMSSGNSASNGYKALVLGQDDGGFFYNNKTGANGELKDFMDMKSLFTYVIPYLKEGNDLVKEWDEVYGIFVYDGVPTEEGHWNDLDIKKSAELKQKYWHNINVARLYEIYTPWVDLMYDCSYAKPETLTVMGERYIVQDPLDPSSYPKNRPMIFSESEMVDYGLNRGDLTKVERLILDCNRGMESRMYELLNYYNFSDASLNTAAAVNCAFEFNVTFSENGLFTNNVNLYPQSFEIADFSYDAFLRFIIANTVGIDMSSQEDFYMDLVQKSSLTTVIVMIALDILSQYVLPAFKIFFLVIVFISAVLLIIVTAFKADPEQKFIFKLFRGLVIPMLYFLSVSIGFAWVVSLFMGTGNNAVTQSEVLSISMGDPVTVMLAMCALDIVILILYWKVAKNVIEDIKHNFKITTNFLTGVYGGAISMVGGAVAGSMLGKAVSGKSSSGTGGSSGGKSGKDSFESSSGVQSSRATRRGSNPIPDDKVDNSRVNETKREVFRKRNNDSEDAKTTEKKKNDINKKISKGAENVKKGAKETGEAVRGAARVAKEVVNDKKNKGTPDDKRG